MTYLLHTKQCTRHTPPTVSTSFRSARPPVRSRTFPPSFRAYYARTFPSLFPHAFFPPRPSIREKNHVNLAFLSSMFQKFIVYREGVVWDDDDKSSLFSHDQRLAHGEENYESYIICYF
jgi:hypothetical protein